MDDEPDLDRALAELAERQVQLEQAQRDLEGRTVVGHSKDRLVTVRGRAIGGITGVEIDPDVFEEHDERSLAAAVLQAVTEVMAASSAAFDEAFDELLTLPTLDVPAPDAPMNGHRAAALVPASPNEVPAAVAAAAAWASASDTDTTIGAAPAAHDAGRDDVAVVQALHQLGAPGTQEAS